MKKIYLLSITILTFLGLACDPSSVSNHQTEDQASSIVKTPYDVIDGRIKFANSDDFALLMSELKDFESERLSEFNESSKITSMMESGNKLSTDRVYKLTSGARTLSQENDDLPIVEDPVFASVLNEHGFLQVDSVVVKVTRDYVFMTSIDKIEKLLDEEYLAELTTTSKVLSKGVMTVSNFGTDDDIWTIEVDRSYEIDPSGDPGSGVATTSRFWQKQYSSNPNRKAVGESWNTWWGIYASFGTETRNEKENFLGWFAAEADRVYLKYEYSYDVEEVINIYGEIGTSTVIRHPPAITIFNDDCIKKVLDQKTGTFGCTFDFNNSSTSCEVKNTLAGPFKLHYFRADHQITNMGQTLVGKTKL